ncbi:MAG: hypothetical protein RIF42_00980 [Parvibaculaceae bacterium]
MSMGLFDFPAPLFGAVEALLQPLPPAARLALWAAVAAGLSMWLYKLLSPQKKLAEAEAEALAARRELNAFDGEMDEAWPMISRMFRAAGSRLWLALPPALLASLPIVALIVWLSNDYGYRFPAENVHVPAEAAPARYHAAVTGAGDQDRRVLVREPEGEIVSDVPLAAPVPVIEKRRWWNWLIANPTGYLPADAPVERVEVRLPALEVVPFGPSWMRGWEALFFALFLAFSLVIKKVGKIS